MQHIVAFAVNRDRVNAYANHDNEHSGEYGNETVIGPPLKGARQQRFSSGSVIGGSAAEGDFSGHCVSRHVAGPNGMGAWNKNPGRFGTAAWRILGCGASGQALLLAVVASRIGIGLYPRPP